MPKRALSGGHAAMTLLRDTLIILRGLGASAARRVPAVYLTAPVGRAAVTGRAATHSTADHPAACHATAIIPPPVMPPPVIPPPIPPVVPPPIPPINTTMPSGR